MKEQTVTQHNEDYWDACHWTLDIMTYGINLAAPGIWISDISKLAQ